MTDVDALLTEIAKKHLHLETLETRNADSLDFHDTAVWSIQSALREAYQRGREVALPKRRRKVATGREWLMAFPDARADCGIDVITYEPAEVEEIVARRSARGDERFLSTLDVRRLVLGLGLRAEELDLGRKS